MTSSSACPESLSIHSANFTADFGQTLSEITLPGAWQWKNPNAYVGMPGENLHTAIFPFENAPYHQSFELPRVVTVGEIPTGTNIINLAWNDATMGLGGTGWSFDVTDQRITLEEGADVIVVGTGNGRHIYLGYLTETATITLRDVDWTGTPSWSPIFMANSDMTLTLKLEGTNTLTGVGQYPSIHAYGHLIVEGTGSLKAQGGEQGGAGIGGSANGISNVGLTQITINSGTIEAIGGNGFTNAGAGIGGGGRNSGSGGLVAINGGTVIATGGRATDPGYDHVFAAGIGAGGTNIESSANGGILIMEGNAVVFASSLSNNTGGTANTDGVTNGILFVDGVGEMYGDEMTIGTDVDIPAFTIHHSPFTLTIHDHQTLNIAAGTTLCNEGQVYKTADATINHSTSHPATPHLGTWTCNPYTEIGSNTINLAMETPFPFGIGWWFDEHSNTYIITDDVILTGNDLHGRNIEISGNPTITLEGNATLSGDFYFFGSGQMGRTTATLSGNGSLNADHIIVNLHNLIIDGDVVIFVDAILNNNLSEEDAYLRGIVFVGDDRCSTRLPYAFLVSLRGTKQSVWGMGG
jgi:hypothetical protein